MPAGRPQDYNIYGKPSSGVKKKGGMTGKRKGQRGMTSSTYVTPSGKRTGKKKSGK